MNIKSVLTAGDVGGQLACRLSSTVETDNNDRKFFFPVAFGDKFEDANELLTE
jgi:hypothetical protein